MKLEWSDRTLIGDDGLSIVSVTSATPTDVFERFKLEINKRLDELTQTAIEFQVQRTNKKQLIQAPRWSKQRDRIINECAKIAGLKDS